MKILKVIPQGAGAYATVIGVDNKNRKFSIPVMGVDSIAGAKLKLNIE